MCGITGIINFDFDGISKSDLQSMADSIAHRGPDGEGFYTSSSVGFGHRRLAIIDLSEAANQPFIAKDNRFILVYNGEVYNFREIKKELIARGYTFKSSSDSEVILYSWQEWGKDCVTKFNGMFAFAILDTEKNQVNLVRDRYGIKPLYFYQKGNLILFGSEQKAIKANSHYHSSLDKEGLIEYLTFQNFFTDKTLTKDIKLLPPASITTIALKNREVKTEVYWDYSFNESSDIKDYQEYKEELDRLLNQAVNRQIVSDVELGSFLSGGMDSGTLTALASQKLPYIKTFTCGFDLSSASGLELTFDERAKAEAMSALFKTEHYEMVLKAGDMERCMSKLVTHLEEPRVGQSYPNYYASHLASKFVKVVLSGAGGDELFGGYPWRYYRAVSSKNFKDYSADYYNYWQRLLNKKEREDVFAPIWADVKHVDTYEIFNNVFKNFKGELTGPEDSINLSLYFEAKTFLHGLFVVEDKLSMAHGLETRVPFMDNDLVDFAMNCPVNFKINKLHENVRINENENIDKATKYFEKTNDGKQILRDVMGRYIPSDITGGLKQGFSAPDASWFKGESIDYVREVLLDDKAKIYNFLDKKSVGSLLQEHFDGSNNRRLLIWSLLSLENELTNNDF